MNKLVNFRPHPATKSLIDSFIEDFFNRDIAGFIGSDQVFFQPAVNIAETDDRFLIEVAAPGFEKPDFEVKVEGNQLIIRGTRVEKEAKSAARFTRREFQSATFSRSFTLPDAVNQNEVTAVYTNGILAITLPKNEKAQPTVKAIEIG